MAMLFLSNCTHFISSKLLDAFLDRYEYSEAVVPTCNGPSNILWLISVRHKLSLPGSAKKSNTVATFLLTIIVPVVVMIFLLVIYSVVLMGGRGVAALRFGAQIYYLIYFLSMGFCLYWLPKIHLYHENAQFAVCLYLHIPDFGCSSPVGTFV